MSDFIKKLTDFGNLVPFDYQKQNLIPIVTRAFTPHHSTEDLAEFAINAFEGRESSIRGFDSAFGYNTESGNLGQCSNLPIM